ncbi:MAG: plasma-membrane proton-efflux P-type ATPase [Thermoleophilia bacterium]
MAEKGSAGGALSGLSSAEAATRLKHYGSNAVVEEKPHPVLSFLRKFWDPVPWMLEVTIILEIVLGRIPEAVIIAVLLFFNSGVSFFQEGRAQTALELLKSRLRVQTRVLRNGRWQLVPAEELVPGDAIHVRMGDLVPADLKLTEGLVELDQSALTGESLPVERGAGEAANAGAVVRRGEASGEVTATGSRTYFGKTAELVSAARTVSHLESIIFNIVKYLVLLDLALVLLLLVYSVTLTRSLLPDVLPFSLILIVASVPAALPATFTLATSLGALELARIGVLVTRLSAIEEGAAMQVLCVDKTGTITQNRLALASMVAYAPHSEEDLLRLAALASEEATQDPLDMAILAAARERSLLDRETPQRLEFLPFDPARKCSEAVVRKDGERFRVVKGAPQAIVAQVSRGAGEAGRGQWAASVLAADDERLESSGYRVLAVAAGPEGTLGIAGLVALEDPPRPDSPDLVKGLYDLGVRVIMITGDALATARVVAARVGIKGAACSLEELRQKSGRIPECNVFAGVFPEDKFQLVKSLQGRGLTVGMTGDGVNDAPALKQAEAGIAVASATDVAKAAASMVLTNPGLKDLLTAVESSRRIYQRMLTYTLNKVIKTLQIAVFLSLGVIFTGEFIITPLLIVLLIFANDFVTMAIATDRVTFSRSPDRWQIRSLFLTGLLLAAMMLVLSFAVFFAARNLLGLSPEQVQTLVFVLLVFTGQGTIYLIRERRNFWRSRPSRWLVLSSALDIAVVSFLSIEGILMTSISAALVASLLLVVAIYLFLVDFIKLRVFRLFALR